MSIAVMNVFRAYDVYNSGRSAASSRMSRAEEKKDMVALSTQAKDFQTIKKALVDSPEVRIERVNEIKHQIEANRYDVSARMVADKIMGSIG